MTGVKSIGIIPARFSSTRFPGKPLTLIGSQSMVERVYKQALKSKLLNEVIVATDDARIFDHVAAFGGKVMMTGKHHASGTDRCAEVISKLALPVEVVVNIQGDEPFIDPSQIDALISRFDDRQVQIATLIKKISDESELYNRNVVKAAIDHNCDALLFGRDTEVLGRIDKANAGLGFFKHVGIYAYRPVVLRQISNLPQSESEISESLEQLRWLDNGYKIRTVLTDRENFSVDVPEDILRLKSIFNF